MTVAEVAIGPAGATGGAAPARRRMRADDRRRQLLDAAAQLIVERGASAMSMEALAAAAGVSKALPYKHFDNSEAVLAELYRRETTELGRSVWRALRDVGPANDPTGDPVRVGVHAYFDELARRGPVLASLSHPGSTIASVADPDQADVIFEVEVLNRFHGLGRTRAKVVAGMVQGAVVGAAATWLAGRAPRADLEDALVTMITSLVPPAATQ